MTKILNPKECLKRFIEGKIQHNRELYEAGSKNLYFEWEDFGNDILNQEELLESYVQQCSELRIANESLKRDIERLNHYKEDYFVLKKSILEDRTVRKTFNLYKCDCKIIVAEGQKTYTRTYFIIGSREEIAERKALLYMEREYAEELEGKCYAFQPSISCFVYNCIV